MRHHYVPQFLLREWSGTTLDNKVEAFRLDLPHLPSSRHATKFVGFEDDLYALTMPIVAGMDQQAVEKNLLRHIDDLGARVLQKLKTLGFQGLSPSDRVDWARFLMSLRLRQPDIIQILRTESSEHLATSLAEGPEEYESIATVSEPSSLPEWVELRFPGLIENFGMSFFHELVDDPKVGDKILRMKWWLWDFSKEKHHLLLADHPCVFTVGIDDPNIVIALPISPNRAFMATNSEGVASIMRKQRPKDLLTRLNESSLSQARVRIYSCDSSQRRFISNRLHLRTRSGR